MLSKINPIKTKEWSILQETYNQKKGIHIKYLFQNNSNRFEAFSTQHQDILFDYSKNSIDQETLTQLIDLANACELPKAIASMFSGVKINETENLSLIHI
jgi:glucose-6-phosphate isomerase